MTTEELLATPRERFGEIRNFGEGSMAELDRVLGLYGQRLRSVKVTVESLVSSYRIITEAGRAVRQLRLEGAPRRTGEAHILYNGATVAILLLLPLPAGAGPSPNVAVVDPLRKEALRAIAEAAGFSKEAVDAWERNYLVSYEPGVPGEIERATQEAETRIAQRLPGAAAVPIFSMPDALNAFGARLKVILESFGLTFQSGALTDGVIQALYSAAQA